ncbi:MAG TPA: hypothetical protein ENK80_00590 [Rhodobacterales bacterium]|nr:hypothetical protein [Rhodobacterales bacterium]
MKPVAMFLWGAAALMLAGCDPVEPGPDPTCPPPDFHALVGQPQSAAEGIFYGGEMRIIRPGMAVTLDYSPSRMNVEIGADGQIVRIFCG